MKHQLKPTTTRRTLQWFWYFTKPNKWFMIGGLSLAIIGVIVQDVIPPLIVSHAFNTIQQLYENGGLHSFWQLDHFAWLYIGFIAAAFVVWRTQVVLTWVFEVRGIQKIMEHVFDHLQHQSSTFHANRFGGALVSNANKFVGGYERFMDELTWSITTGIVMLLGSVIALATVSWQYAIALFAGSTVYLFIMGRRTLRGMRFDRALADAESDRTAKLADTITNVSTVRSFAGEEVENQIFGRETERNKRIYWRLLRFVAVNEIISQFGTSLITIAAFVGGLVVITVFDAPLGALFLSVNYTMAVSRRLWESNRVIRNVNRSLGDAATMTEILDMEPGIRDVADPLDAHIVRGEIRFRDVTFAYPENVTEKPLFDNLNLRIKPGEKIGLVGHSGGGKTTITQLLLRSMDIQGGEVTLDGYDIARMRQQDVRRSIASVPQESILFHRTLAENIAYGKLGASQQEIEAVAKMAHAHEFIERLPDGYKTLVGERGVKLSGGQRQRVAIARAMLKNAPILVLDEATSALDSESEALIQDALWKLMEGRTAIVIAHRLSTVQKMDRIIVLDAGVVAEEGTHKELLRQSGIYANLWNRQSGGFLDE
ncbi:ABC transporter ATP-binding protein [Patescibacteria group bacterium]|nr:MAG: ABC transporter ATP-binding protein [Patescibacteria group bacterium]